MDKRVRTRRIFNQLRGPNSTKLLEGAVKEENDSLQFYPDVLQAEHSCIPTLRNYLAGTQRKDLNGMYRLYDDKAGISLFLEGNCANEQVKEVIDVVDHRLIPKIELDAIIRDMEQNEVVPEVLWQFKEKKEYDGYTVILRSK